jgi:hypothetical protein
MLPNAERGAKRVGRAIGDLSVIANPLTAIGSSQAAIDAQRESHRSTLATLYSTPNYWPSLSLYGWSDVGTRLKSLVKESRWDELPAMITDEMLEAFVPSGFFDEIGSVLSEQFGDIADGILISLPDDPKEDAAVARAIEDLHRA